MGKELTILQGKVSHIRHTSTTSGAVDKGSGSIGTSHQASFRINNKPAIFSGSPSLGEGEDITLVGYEGGEFGAYALRNDTTGVEYIPNSFSGIFIFFGWTFTIGSILSLKSCVASARPGYTTILEEFIAWCVLGGWAFVGGLAAIYFGRKSKRSHKRAIELLRGL